MEEDLSFSVKICSFCRKLDRAKIEYFFEQDRERLDNIQITEMKTYFHHMIEVSPFSRIAANSGARRLENFINMRSTMIEVVGRQNITQRFQKIQQYQKVQKEPIRTKPNSKQYLGNKIYVSGLPFGVNDSELSSYFSQIGEIKNAYVCKQYRKGAYAFGFVCFYNPDNCWLAVQEKKILFVSETTSKWLTIKSTVDRQASMPKAHK